MDGLRIVGTAILLVVLTVSASGTVSGAVTDGVTWEIEEPRPSHAEWPTSNAADASNATSNGTYYGTVVATFDTTRSERAYEARVWANRSAGAYRIEYRSPADVRWDVVVSNGSRLWAYDRDDRRVVTTTAVNGNFAEEVTNDVRPLRFDDFFFSPSDLVERLDLYHARALGTATVRDRETHAVQLRRVAPTTRRTPETVTVWLDEEHLFPVKLRAVSEHFTGTVNRTLTYRNLTLGEPIDPRRFAFDVPANATVVTPDDLRSRPGVPEPTLPDDYRLTSHGVEDATTVDSNGSARAVHSRTISAEYRNLTTTIVVENRTGLREGITVDRDGVTINATLGDRLPWPTDDSATTTVQIRDADGAAWSVNETTYVAWPCDDHLYVIYSSLSQSALADAARTISCTADSDGTSGTPNDSRSSPARPDAPARGNGTRIAPGVTTDGVHDPKRLVAAHDDALSETDFVVNVSETRTIRRGEGPSMARFHQRVHYDAGTATYRATYRNESGGDERRTVVWGNGTTAVVRTTKYDHAVYERPVSPSSAAPTGSSYLLLLLSRYEFTVRGTTNLSAPSRTKLELADERAGVTATLVVDRDGRIHEFTTSSSNRSREAIARASYRSFTHRDVPPQRPEWVDRAPADADIDVRLGVDVEPTYVDLSHRFGETIPAGTIVEVTAGGSTYATRLQAPLSNGERRQLYVENGSLVATTDRERAERRGQPMSGPVTVLLVTDDGVLVDRRRVQQTDASD